MTTIGLLGDTHIGITKRKSIERILKNLCINVPKLDVLIHAGDYCGGVIGHKSVTSTLKLIREYLPTTPYLSVIGNHDCLSEDTEILTRNGWKNIDNISYDDSIATMGANNCVEWQPVQKIIVRNFDPNKENMYKYNARISMNVTSKHRLYTYSRPKINGERSLNIKHAEDCNNDFSVISALNSQTSVSFFTDEEIRLAAWMCTDSHINKYKKLTLYQRKSNVHKITNLLNNLKIPYVYKERDRDITQIQGKILKSQEINCEIYFSTETSKILIEKLQVETNTALPPWFQDLSNEQWEIFLKTLIDADGSTIRDLKNCFVFYGKKKICEDVQRGCVLHGWRASLVEYRKDQWKVNISKKMYTRILNFPKCSTKQYSGKVWCITVKNGNFLCRHDNKVHLTGNCWFRGSRIKNEYADFPYYQPSIRDYENNYLKICESFKKYNVHFFDEDGIFRFNNLVFLGASGWYSHPNPPTNDYLYLPSHVEGNTHAWLYNKAMKIFEKNVSQVELDSHEKLVFVSHFPVVRGSNDRAFSEFSWDSKIDEFLIREFKCNYFFNGHAHQHHTGPLRYESGTDYNAPKYQIVEVT